MIYSESFWLKCKRSERFYQEDVMRVINYLSSNQHVAHMFKTSSYLPALLLTGVFCRSPTSLPSILPWVPVLVQRVLMMMMSGPPPLLDQSRDVSPTAASSPTSRVSSASASPMIDPGFHGLLLFLPDRSSRPFGLPATPLHVQLSDASSSGDSALSPDVGFLSPERQPGLYRLTEHHFSLRQLGFPLETWFCPRFLPHQEYLGSFSLPWCSGGIRGRALEIPSFLS